MGLGDAAHIRHGVNGEFRAGLAGVAQEGGGRRLASGSNGSWGLSTFNTVQDTAWTRAGGKIDSGAGGINSEGAGEVCADSDLRAAGRVEVRWQPPALARVPPLFSSDFISRRPVSGHIRVMG